MDAVVGDVATPIRSRGRRRDPTTLRGVEERVATHALDLADPIAVAWVLEPNRVGDLCGHVR